MEEALSAGTTMSRRAEEWMRAFPVLEEYLWLPKVMHSNYLVRRMKKAAEVVLLNADKAPGWLVDEARVFRDMHGVSDLSDAEVARQSAYRITAQLKAHELRKLKARADKAGKSLPDMVRLLLVGDSEDS